MVPAVFAHQAPGFQALGFSPGLTLYLTVALLALLALSLRANWPESRFPSPTEVEAAAPPTGPWPGANLPAAVRVALRAGGVAGLALLLACGWAGSHQIGANPISIAIFWVFWIGGQLVAALLGDWWQLISPYDTIASWVGRAAGAGWVGRAAEGSPTAEDGDWWVPAALLGTFAWMWLCWPEGIRPRSAAGWLTAYTLVMVVGAAAGGRSWVRRNEGFGVAFSLIAGCSPVDWTGPRPRLRHPLAGMARTRVGRRELAVLAMLLGTVLFDAVGSSGWWADLVGTRSAAGYTAFNTAGLVWLALSAALAWAIAARAAVHLAAPHDLDVELADLDPDSIEQQVAERAATAPYRLAAPLALLAAGFAVSHESSALMVNAQSLVALLSDPFAEGWNLLGTATIVVNPVFPSAGGQAWIALLLIVAALLGTFVGLHDRVLDRFGPEGGAQASWAMLGFAVVAAIAALKLLLGV